MAQMNDPYGLIQSGLPPELAAQMRGISREQAIAEALMAQSQKPMETNRMAGGYVLRNSPLEGITKLLQAYGGRKGMEASDKKFADLGTKYQTMLADEVSGFMGNRQGTPAKTIAPDPQEAQQSDDYGTPEVPPVNMPATTSADQLFKGMASTNPIIRQIATAEYQRLNKAPEKIDLGDKWKVTYPDGRVVMEPKSATPDAAMRRDTTLQTHGTPSGSAVLQNQGANQRHALPSGNAILGSQTTLQTHATPSGSAQLSAATTRRGQDMTDARSREANAVAVQTARLKHQELENKLRQQGVANAGVAASYQIAVDTLGRLKGHPGMGEAVGIGFEKTAIPFVGPIIPGTPRADFVAELDAFKSQTFLPMVQQLRGMGALSDAEGKRLTDAVGALSTGMSEKSFKESAGRIEKDLRDAFARTTGSQMPAAPALGDPPPGAVRPRR